MHKVEIIKGADNAAIAAWIGDKLSAALAANTGDIAISLPGGSTPFPILEILAKADLDWKRIIVWPGDDRIVPENHEASNTGKIRAFLEPLGARIAVLAGGVAEPPQFALTWLGMGADGHIASLFPNTDPKSDDPQMIRRLTPNPLPPEAPFDRITLTIPALIRTGEMMFVIRGDDKLAVFEGAMQGEHDLPIARLLAAYSGRAVCFA